MRPKQLLSATTIGVAHVYFSADFASQQTCLQQHLSARNTTTAAKTKKLPAACTYGVYIQCLLPSIQQLPGMVLQQRLA